MISLGESAPVAQQRSEAYWFLATLFADAPSPTALTALAASVDDAGDAGFAAEIFTAVRAAADAADTAQTLAVEHTRLFGGISEEYGPPPPYESMWREGRLMGESTVAVAQAFAAADYRPDARFAPCDHIVEELRFMAALCGAEACATDVVSASALRTQQQAFLEGHLAAWAGAYCERLAAATPVPVYRALARVCATLVVQDARYLRSES